MAVGSTLLDAFRPFWKPSMGLNENHIGPVGFLFDEGQVGSTARLMPVGTFFVISFPAGVPGAHYVFLVTAQHVVQEYNRLIAVIRSDNAEPLRWDLSDGWFFPDDPKVDLAVHPLPALGDKRPKVWPLEESVDEIRVMPKYGERTYFVGLLEPVESTWAKLIPVVRRGALAAPFQKDVTWGTKKDPDKWGPATVHLIDCRSWKGFSGSPCYMESMWPGPQSTITDPLPEGWSKNLKILTGLDRENLETIYYFQSLMGVFVGYVKKTSIGIILPMQYLRALIESEDVVAWRKQQEEEAKKQRVERGDFAEEQAIETTPSYRREDFLSDLHRVTRKPDKEQSDPEASETEA